MIPLGEPELLLSSSSRASVNDKLLHQQVNKVVRTRTTTTHESNIILSPPLRRSCLKGCSSLYSSTCSLESSFSSFSSSSSSPSGRRVTFHDRVFGRTFLPDWADPRVESYEKKRRRNKNSSQIPLETELRQLDMKYIELARQEQRREGMADVANHSPLLSSLTLPNEDEWSPRGLECQIDDEVSNHKRHLRLQSNLKVLLLQARNASWEDMARAYSTVARQSHVEAHRRGLLDELDAHHDVGQVVLNDLMEQRKAKWPMGPQRRDVVVSAPWMAKRPARRSRRFSDVVVGEMDDSSTMSC
jgi:hypothetical protein